MLGSSYKIATIWGIPIRIHISLIILLAVFAISSGLSGGAMAIVLLIGLEVGIFTSIALHELGHSFVALRKGCRVREITLMFIGGAAQMEEIPERPLDEFQMAIAGPLVSIALGFGLWFIGDYAGGYLHLESGLWPFPFTSHLAIHCNVIQFLGVINLGLAAFNLLPVFPMDGGRLLRALLVRSKGRVRATWIASRVGKLMALVFGIRGFTTLPGGWFLMFIALFIYSAGEKEYQMVVLQEQMKRGEPRSWPFGNWMRREPPPVPPRVPPEDQVSISPPPYQRGPEQKSELRPNDEDDPFKQIFGR